MHASCCQGKAKFGRNAVGFDSFFGFQMSAKYRIPLAYNILDQTDYAAVEAVLRSGRLTQGEQVAAFEAAFAAYHGARHAILVNSGSSANLIAIEAVYYCSKIKPAVTRGTLTRGDEVIIPGLCWPTTLTPLLNHGLQPVFCDISLDSLNATVATVEAVRSAATRAVIAVPVLGNADGLEELRAYCAREKLILIEDACESLGARTASGGLAGTFGLVSSFSFYFSHHMTTIEGGAILTDSPEIAEICRALRSHGWTRDLKTDVMGAGSAEGIDPRFNFFLPGYNVRATEITAAIGLTQLNRLDEMIAHRRRIAAGRIAALDPASGRVRVPGRDIAARHSWMTFPLIFLDKVQKQAAQSHLEESGIETRPIIVGNLLRQPVAKMLGLLGAQPELPVCDQVFERGLMIGLNPYSDGATEDYLQLVLRAAMQASVADMKC